MLKSRTQEEKKPYMQKMWDFLMKEVPDVGCMVCKVDYVDENYKGEKYPKTEYFLIEKHKIASGYMFIINSHFWYDYDFLFDEKWEIIYKHFGSPISEPKKDED